MKYIYINQLMCYNLCRKRAAPISIYVTNNLNQYIQQAAESENRTFGYDEDGNLTTVSDGASESAWRKWCLILTGSHFSTSLPILPGVTGMSRTELLRMLTHFSEMILTP
ncbi:MAG: hypothetical protein GY749_02610, partial [Desulfobacteraceae bacterium]|nr:hypothetical protein [Desulfobacteraceae bacterium]